MTPGNSSLRNTVAYEPSTGLFHWWGFVADDPNFPSSASTLSAVVHATTRDGIHFVSDANLQYGVGSASYAAFGASIDPPLDYLRAAFDAISGSWKLLNWTENDQVSNPSFGQYNYNTSVNDLGSVASNTSVVHQGPLDSPVAGNHVGAFGLIDGVLFLRVDIGMGGVGQFDYTDGIPASTGNESAESDLYSGTPYCWFLTPGCGSTDARIPAYVHNAGRTLRHVDGSVETYYTFRDANTGARLDKQIWYVESDDNGASWSAPAGIFADGSTITIDGQALDSAAGSANFSNVDVILGSGPSRIYFSTQDATGNFVFVSSPAMAVDTISADGFDGCTN